MGDNASASTRTHDGGPTGGSSARARARDVDPIGEAEREHLLRGFASELQSMRQGLNLTMGELASRSGVSERWIRELGHGRGRPSDGICARLAAGLLPGCKRVVQAMTDLRFQQLAGSSLRRWERRRPPRESVVRAYAEAEEALAAMERRTSADVAVFLDAVTESFLQAAEPAR